MTVADLWGNLREALRHSAYRGVTQDTDGPAWVIHDIFEVINGARDKVELSFYAKGEYNRVLDALTELERFRVISVNNRPQLARSGLNNFVRGIGGWHRIVVTKRITMPPISTGNALLNSHQALSDRVFPVADVSVAIEENIYEVEEGDNLWKVAQKALGDGKRWDEIYNANREVIGDNFDYILPGQRLVIPVTSTGDALPDSKPTPTGDTLPNNHAEEVSRVSSVADVLSANTEVLAPAEGQDQVALEQIDSHKPPELTPDTGLAPPKGESIDALPELSRLSRL